MSLLVERTYTFLTVALRLSNISRYNLIMAAIPIVILLIYADTEEKSNQFMDEEVLIKELLRPILLYVHL